MKRYLITWSKGLTNKYYWVIKNGRSVGWSTNREEAKRYVSEKSVHNAWGSVNKRFKGIEIEEENNNGK